MGGYHRYRFISTEECQAEGTARARTLTASDASRAYMQESLLPGPTHIVSVQAPPRVDMSTAEVSSPIIATRRRISGGFGSAIMSKSACRRLFVDVSDEERRQQDEYDRNLEADMREAREARSRRWRYDFQTGIPRDGCWERVPAEQVPEMYRETMMSPRPRARIVRPRSRPICSARTSESAEQTQSADSFLSNGRAAPASLCDVATSSDIGNAVNLSSSEHSSSERLETETGTATVPVAVRSQSQEENNPCGVSYCVNPSAGSSNSSHTKQQKIYAFFSHRKRSRSVSESGDATSAKLRKTSPALPDRPQSAPAAIATSARS